MAAKLAFCDPIGSLLLARIEQLLAPTTQLSPSLNRTEIWHHVTCSHDCTMKWYLQDRAGLLGGSVTRWRSNRIESHKALVTKIGLRWLKNKYSKINICACIKIKKHFPLWVQHTTLQGRAP